jgi:hypothetical protein
MLCESPGSQRSNLHLAPGAQQWEGVCFRGQGISEPVESEPELKKSRFPDLNLGAMSRSEFGPSRDDLRS